MNAIIKKIFLPVIFFISFTTIAQKRNNYNYNSRTNENSGSSFEQGNLIFSAGYGFGNFAQTILNFALDAYPNKVNVKTNLYGPIFFKGEYAITNAIGVGINFATITNKASFTFSDTLNNQPQNFTATLRRPNTSFLAHVNYHFVRSSKFDVYAGMGLGLRLGSFKFSSDYKYFNRKFSIPYSYPVGFEITVGARYYPIPNLGIYSEFGAAKGIIQFGIVGKI